MERQLMITKDPIAEADFLGRRGVFPGMGAAVYFAGLVRESESGRPINGIEYEAFERMAEHQFELIFGEMERRWPIASVRLIHRVGLVKVGEPSLLVEVIAPHRAEAFAACQFLIEEMKRVVPIWKRPVAG